MEQHRILNMAKRRKEQDDGEPALFMSASAAIADPLL
jgi:hypothetical protein